MAEEIDHKYTDEVVCPYCGHAHSDSFELSDSDDKFQCYECRKEFGYERDIEITYNSWKNDEPLPPTKNEPES